MTTPPNPETPAPINPAALEAIANLPPEQIAGANKSLAAFAANLPVETEQDGQETLTNARGGVFMPEMGHDGGNVPAIGLREGLAALAKEWKKCAVSKQHLADVSGSEYRDGESGALIACHDDLTALLAHSEPKQASTEIHWTSATPTKDGTYRFRPSPASKAVRCTVSEGRITYEGGIVICKGAHQPQYAEVREAGTPRTDAECDHPSNFVLDNDMRHVRPWLKLVESVVPADFARTLERQLTEIAALAVDQKAEIGRLREVVAVLEGQRVKDLS